MFCHFRWLHHFVLCNAVQTKHTMWRAILSSWDEWRRIRSQEPRADIHWLWNAKINCNAEKCSFAEEQHSIKFCHREYRAYWRAHYWNEYWSDENPIIACSIACTSRWLSLSICRRIPNFSTDGIQAREKTTTETYITIPAYDYFMIISDQKAQVFVPHHFRVNFANNFQLVAYRRSVHISCTLVLIIYYYLLSLNALRNGEYWLANKIV